MKLIPGRHFLNLKISLSKKKKKNQTNKQTNFEIRRKSFKHLAYVHVAFPTLAPAYAHP